MKIELSFTLLACLIVYINNMNVNVKTPSPTICMWSQTGVSLKTSEIQYEKLTAGSALQLLLILLASFIVAYTVSF